MNNHSSKHILLHLLLAAGVVASFACIGWIVFDAIIMPRVARQGWPVLVVPNLEGLSPEQAAQKLANMGLEPTLDPVRRSSDRLPPDVVILQKPEAGDSVKQGHVVRFWLSAGPTSVRLPDLKGRDSAEAATLLASSELLVADSISWQQSPETPYGKVLSTFPKAGTILSRGSRVGLVLSSGDSSSAANDTDTTKPRIF